MSLPACRFVGVGVAAAAVCVLLCVCFSMCVSELQWTPEFLFSIPACIPHGSVPQDDSFLDMFFIQNKLCLVTGTTVRY